jgi:hypothetical protein
MPAVILVGSRSARQAALLPTYPAECTYSSMQYSYTAAHHGVISHTRPTSTPASLTEPLGLFRDIGGLWHRTHLATSAIEALATAARSRASALTGGTRCGPPVSPSRPGPSSSPVGSP